MFQRISMNQVVNLQNISLTLKMTSDSDQECSAVCL